MVNKYLLHRFNDGIRVIKITDDKPLIIAEDQRCKSRGRLLHTMKINDLLEIIWLMKPSSRYNLQLTREGLITAIKIKTRNKLNEQSMVNWGDERLIQYYGFLSEENFKCDKRFLYDLIDNLLN